MMTFEQGKMMFDQHICIFSCYGPCLPLIVYIY